jgi:hypothetical protein
LALASFTFYLLNHHLASLIVQSDTSWHLPHCNSCSRLSCIRELEISAAEERSLKKDVPKSEEEFEKMVRSSPNSSYVWINYMAFMLDVADIEKARSIAER